MIYKGGNGFLHKTCLQYSEYYETSQFYEEERLQHLKLLKTLLSEYKLDPWLLNSNNETPFDLLGGFMHSDTYYSLLDIWTKSIYQEILLDDSINTNITTTTTSINTVDSNNNMPVTVTTVTTTTNFINVTIFNKIKHLFDKATSNNFINKVTTYV